MKRILFAIVPLFVTLHADDFTDTQWDVLKSKALNRPRKIIVNNDGCDAMSYPRKMLPVTLDKFYSLRMGLLKGKSATSIFYSMNAVGIQLNSRLKNSPRPIHDIETRPKYPSKINASKQLYAQTSKDPIQLALEFAKANNHEFFITLRFNNAHDSFQSAHFPKIKKEHPEYLFGKREKAKCPPCANWSALDFSLAPVRKIMHDFVVEAAENYDVDGIDLDFCRFPCFFRSAAWGKTVTDRERSLMTQLIRQIRKSFDEIGKKRGRPVLLSIRVPDSPVVCRAIGIDLELWMKDKLFDIMIGGSDFGYYDLISKGVALAKKYNIKYYRNIDASWIRRKNVFNRNDLPSYNGQLAAAYFAGVDGVCLFNLSGNRDLTKIKTSKSELAKTDKKFFVTLNSWWCKLSGVPEDFQKIPPLSPYDRISLLNANPITVYLQTGKASKTDFEYKVYVSHTGPPENLGIKLNDNKLTRESYKNGVSVFRVENNMVKNDINKVKLIVLKRPRSSMRIILKGDAIMPNGARLRWWRPFGGRRDDRKAEEIIDGALRISDRLSKSKYLSNLLYPLTDFGKDKPVEMSFELKTSPGSDPLTNVLRIANGKHVEIIDFQPKKIRLVYNKKSVPFDTSKFRPYNLLLKQGILTLKSGNKIIFKEKLTALAGKRVNFLPLPCYFAKGMNTESLLIGSLSLKGKGAGYWKNISLRRDIFLRDLVLTMRKNKKSRN